VNKTLRAIVEKVKSLQGDHFKESLDCGTVIKEGIRWNCADLTTFHYGLADATRNAAYLEVYHQDNLVFAAHSSGATGTYVTMFAQGGFWFEELLKMKNSQAVSQPPSMNYWAHSYTPAEFQTLAQIRRHNARSAKINQLARCVARRGTHFHDKSKPAFVRVGRAYQENGLKTCVTRIEHQSKRVTAVLEVIVVYADLPRYRGVFQEVHLNKDVPDESPQWQREWTHEFLDKDPDWQAALVREYAKLYPTR